MNGLTYTLTWLGDHFMLVFIGCLEKLREVGRNGNLRTKLRLRYSCLKRK